MDETELGALENPAEWGRNVARRLVNRWGLPMVRKGKTADQIVDHLLETVLQPVDLTGLEDDEIVEILQEGFIERGDHLLVADAASMGDRTIEMDGALSAELYELLGKAEEQVAGQKGNVVPLFLRNADAKPEIDPTLIDTNKERKQLEEKIHEEPGHDPIPTRLKNLGIRVLDTNPIGEGSYGKVYLTSFKGHDTVTKVYDFGANTEVLSKIKSLQSTAPAAVRKHLPKIYLNMSLGDDDGHILVMERLKPLSDELRIRLFDPQAFHSDEDTPEPAFLNKKISDRMLDVDFLRSAVQNWLDTDLPNSLFQGLKRRPAQAEYLRIRSAMMHPIVRVLYATRLNGTHSDAVHSTFKAMKPEIVKSLVAELGPGIEPVAKLLAEKIWTIKGIIASGWDLPYSSDEEFGSPVQRDATSSGLYAALKWLQSKGLNWKDVKHDNLMQRDDGTLVFVDFDLFNE